MYLLLLRIKLKPVFDLLNIIDYKNLFIYRFNLLINIPQTEH